MGGVRGSDARVERLASWRARVAVLLAQASPHEADTLGATVVGMFDAGARDAEVAVFLAPALPHLAPPELAALAARLHRAAADPPPHVAP